MVEESNKDRYKTPVIGSPEPLLDRLGATRTVERDYPEPISAFAELLDEGVALLQRAFRSIAGPADIPDTMVLAVLFRHVLAMLDGFHVLISAAATYASQTPLRSALEGSIYLDWILRDKETRGLQFYVGEKRQRLRFLESLEAGTPKNAEFIADAKRKYPDLVTLTLDPANQELVRAEKQRLLTHLAERRLAPINQSFEALSRKGIEVPWYRAKGGPENLGALAKKVEMWAEYDRLHGGMSQVMHASTTLGNIEIPQRGEMVLKPLRHIEELDTHFALATGILLRVLRLVTNRYRADEAAGFSQRYVERFQSRLRMPEIEVLWVTDRD